MANTTPHPSPNSSTTTPPPLIIAPTQTHTQSIIILHGRGSNGPKFGPPLLASSISSTQTLQSAFPQTKFIFPTATLRRAVIYKRRLTHQWFDSWHLSEPTVREELQLDGLRETSSFIHELLRAEIALVGARSVVLWGLSQGCAVALMALLTWDGEPFGAMVGMCGWLPLRRGVVDVMNEEDAGHDDDDDIFEQASTSGSEIDAATSAIAYLRAELGMEEPKPPSLTFRNIPVFLAHGVEDAKVPVTLGREAVACLELLAANVQWREYDGLGHWYSEEMLRDVKDFLDGILDGRGGVDGG